MMEPSTLELTEVSKIATNDVTAAATAGDVAASAEQPKELKRASKINRAKDLYAKGSRNMVVGAYGQAADEFSEVCVLYEDLYGPQSDELGVPYLMYAKALMAVSIEENKVIDLPVGEEAADGEEEEEEGEGDDEAAVEGEEEEAEEEKETNEKKEEKEDKDDKADGDGDGEGKGSDDTKKNEKKKVEDAEKKDAAVEATKKLNGHDKKDDQQTEKEKEVEVVKKDTEKVNEETSSKVTEKEEVANADVKKEPQKEDKKTEEGEAATKKLDDEKPSTSKKVEMEIDDDDDKPSTSNGIRHEEGDGVEEESENEAPTTLQLAWEILELAGKIFEGQGEESVQYLAEVRTELGNIQLENGIFEGARVDYGKAIELYEKYPDVGNRRTRAELFYKMGLAQLMDNLFDKSLVSFSRSTELLDAEIEHLKSKKDPTPKDLSNIKEMEESREELKVKIAELRESRAQVAQVRAALDSYIKPRKFLEENMDAEADPNVCVPGSNYCAAKPNDISHLVKRKKADNSASETECTNSPPAKRPAA